MMDLGGTWKAHLGDDDVRRSAFDVDLVDDDWHDIEVPGPWHHHGALAASHGPVIYRRHFTTDAPTDTTTRTWLQFDAISYQGDVWLDGTYLGDTEGWFIPHTFEITDAVAERRRHMLAIEVSCPPARGGDPKRSLMGAYHDPRFVDTDISAGGIWGAVSILKTGAARFARLRTQCPEANASRATVELRAEVDCPDSRMVEVRTKVMHLGQLLTERTDEHPVAGGLNRLEWKVTIDNPPLWWPWSLGTPSLVDLDIDIIDDGQVTDHRTVRTGLRTVALNDWRMTVNGQTLFTKGTHVVPEHSAPQRGDDAHTMAQARSIRDAGLDLVRIHTHVASEAWYRAADELGLLIWQDAPISGRYQRTVRRQAVRQVRELIDLIGHHPSIAIWCGHDEPDPSEASVGQSVRAAVTRQLLRQQRPSWNRVVLDSAIQRAFTRGDRSRPVIAHAAVLPYAPLFAGTSTNLDRLAHDIDEHELAGLAHALPRLVRYVSALDLVADGTSTARLHRSIEALRRLKYRPSGGFCVGTMSQFAAATDATGWRDALVDACRPVIVTADQLPITVAPGATHVLDVHVTSDVRVPLDDVLVTAQLSWQGGSHRWAWRGGVDADAVTKVGSMSFVVPAAPGELILDLDLVSGERAASNRYCATLVPA
jgi:beta-mannosidase